MFRPAAMLLAAAAVKSTTTPEPNKPEETPKRSLVMRPSELPIYSNAVQCAPKSRSHDEQQADSAIHKKIQEGVSIVRCEVQKGYEAVSKKTEVFGDYIDVARAHTQRSIDYLNEPQNTLPRSGAIAMGGLAGFIFAARGGVIKKIVYTSVGAGLVASLCYPRQAEEQARVALCEGRKAFAVAYNFVKGVKPGDEVPVDPISKFPTSLEELKNIALDVYDETKDMLFPKKK